MKKQFTERKYKKEYLKVKEELETLIENSYSPERFTLPHGSEKIANILSLTLQVMEEHYQHYELRLQQLSSLIHLLHEECNIGELDAKFRGELYNISSAIIRNTGHHEDWKEYSLLIDDLYPYESYNGYLN